MPPTGNPTSAMRFKKLQELSNFLGLSLCKSTIKGDCGYVINSGTRQLMNGPSWCPTLASASQKLQSIKTDSEGIWIVTQSRDASGKWGQ
jgi:hypothetical protein